LKRVSQYTGWLRQFRLLHWLNNLAHRRHLQHNKAIYRKLGIRRSVLRSIDSRVISRYIDMNDPSVIDKLPPSSRPVPNPPMNINWHHCLRQWDEEGFIHLHRYFRDDVVDGINSGIRAGLDEGSVHFNYTGRKIFNAQENVPVMKEVTHDPGILAILHHLFGRPAVHFQTISFLQGSEQAAHSDSVHMTTLPLGYLAGVWVALEDVHPGNGPLTYYPGSHKLPYLLNRDYGNSSNFFLLDSKANARYEARVAAAILADNGIEEQQLSAKAGDVFIWHANLLHGGAPILESESSRRSMVSHYFAEGVLCFHEISERPAIIK
jgi:hypothetical protein